MKQPLFGGDISSFDINKTRFLYWLNFYHHLNTLPDDEKPKISTIENDILLDEYMKKKTAERKHFSRTKHKKRSKASFGKNPEVIQFE